MCTAGPLAGWMADWLAGGENVACAHVFVWVVYAQLECCFCVGGAVCRECNMCTCFRRGFIRLVKMLPVSVGLFAENVIFARVRAGGRFQPPEI